MINAAVVGLGNCASSLVQGAEYCRALGESAIGVPFPELAGYRPADVRVVAAFDVDARKVGRDIAEAVFSVPNCTTIFHRNIPLTGARVLRGPELDGVSAFMRNQPPERSFVLSDDKPLDRDGVVAALKDSKAEVLVNFLPVGSQEASEFYADCAIAAGCAFVNGIPVFLASNGKWADRFRSAGLPILGDDFKAQIGATIVHRTLAHLFDLRQAQLDRSYQLNVGGNTDFLNMADHNRLSSKRHSKTEAVQSVLDERLDENDVRIGPSDYIPWLKDQKVGFIRLEGRLFGGVPTNIELRLSVEDSPNAAAMALIAIRAARIALDRGLAGAIPDASAFIFKHPPEQCEDHEGAARLLRFAAQRPAA